MFVKRTLIIYREVNQQNMKLLVNKAVTFVEEMQKQIESSSDSKTTFVQPKSLVGGKYQTDGVVI